MKTICLRMQCNIFALLYSKILNKWKRATENKASVRVNSFNKTKTKKPSTRNSLGTLIFSWHKHKRTHTPASNMSYVFFFFREFVLMTCKPKQMFSDSGSKRTTSSKKTQFFEMMSIFRLLLQRIKWWRSQVNFPPLQDVSKFAGYEISTSYTNCSIV